MSLKKNILWTWDSRMRWAMPECWKSFEMAYPDQAFPYTADTAFFLKNYIVLIDEVKRWDPKPDIIIWGFLRDSHGGEDAAKRLTEYAQEQGVGIIAGVGTSGYGGVYYEGNHRFSSKKLMQTYPELTVQNKRVDGQKETLRGNTLNPLDTRVIDWLEESISWLCESFSLKGVNLELGDFFVAQDPVSIARRETIRDVKDDFYKMLALHFGCLIERIEKRHPRIELSYATYSDFSKEILEANAAFSRKISSNAMCQWTLTRSNEIENRKALLPAYNRGFAHLFSIANNTDQVDLTDRIARACFIAARSEFDGMGIYGEIGIDQPYAKENYEAFQYYIAHPEAAEKFI